MTYTSLRFLVFGMLMPSRPRSVLMRFAHSRLVGVLAVAVALSIGLLLVDGVGLPVAVVAQQKPSPAKPRAHVSERPDRVSAQLAARLQNSRVEISGERTESLTTWANPDSTFTTEAVAGAIRVKKNGTLVPIDTALVADGTGLRPKAVQADVVVSDGGQEPFASVGRGKHSVGVGWGKALPKPAVKGDTATYADVVPNGDLVVKALPQGFSHSVVLRSRPSGPLEIKLPIATKGLTLSKGSGHSLNLKDSSGKRVATAPAPRMWDSSTDLASGESTHQAEVTTSIEQSSGGTVLVLKPDAAFLNDPALRFPVTIDPTTTLTVTTDTWVATSFPASQRGSTELKAGTYNAGGEVARSYIKFNGIDGLAGKHIISADMRLWSYYSSTCSAGAGVKVSRITGTWAPDTIAFGTEPATTTTGAVTTQTAYGNSASCPANFMHWINTSMVQAWADGAANNGVQVRGASETDSNTWRRFYSSNYSDSAYKPRLAVTYNSYPGAPAQITTGGAHQSGGIWYSTKTPALIASVPDPDGGQVRLDFEVSETTANGGAVLWTGNTPNVTAGQTGQISVPAGILTQGRPYRWRTRGYDGTDYGAWSAYSTYTADVDPPAAPTISCPNYPANAWTPRVAGGDTCTLDTTAADGNGYYWSLDNPNPTKVVNDTTHTGAAKTIAIAPEYAWHTLYAQAFDGLGNRSATTTYSFGAGLGSLATPVDGDRTQEAVALNSNAPSIKNGVTYRYRAGTSSIFPWTKIPAGDVTYPGTTTTVASWPLKRTNTSAAWPPLDWNVNKTIHDAGYGDGPIQLVACFTEPGAINEECSPLATMTLERTAFGASYATKGIGPGEVALQTGDFSIGGGDVNVGGLSIGHDHTTLAPPAEQGAAGVFGPGWTASFPGSGGGDGSASAAGYQFEDHSVNGFVLLTGPDGETVSYSQAADGTFRGVAEADNGSLIVKDSATQFTLTEPDGAKTVYTSVNGHWGTDSADAPGVGNTTNYVRDAQGRPTRILADVPTGVTCTTTLAAGCKALNITYAASTTATGVASGWGDYAGNVTKIDYIAYDPALQTMKTTQVAAYTYDSTGHLRQEWDPRINSALKTTYYYNSEGRISQVTPSGLSPWTIEYDDSGRLAHVSRNTPQGEATQAVVYNVPIGGTGAPVDLTSTATANWGQSVDLPRLGAAVFPASHVPTRSGNGSYQPTSSDFQYGSLTYMDVNGRPVNSAGFGAGAWQISSQRYDDKGHTTWVLDPENRNQALAPTGVTDPYVASQTNSTVRADLLATITTYNAQGDPLSETSPTQLVMLQSGVVISARRYSTHTYNEGRPDSNVDYHLITSDKSKPIRLDGQSQQSDLDTQVTKNGYDPVHSGDESGWTLHAPTMETKVVTGNTDIASLSSYDATGRPVESRMPASNGNDAGTSIVIYYTSGANSSITACGNKPEWAGMLCQKAPKSQAPGTPLPVKTFTYDYWGQIATQKEVSGSSTRLTTLLYDAAGRPSSTSVAVTPVADGGVAIPQMVTAYDQMTGQISTVTAGSAQTSNQYDQLGRVIGYTDASGNQSVTTYDIDGHVKTVNDGKGVTTYTYDGTDSLGKIERRGLATSVDAGLASGPSSLAVSYDGRGKLVSQRFPNSLTVTVAVNSSGKSIGLTYEKDGVRWFSYSSQWNTAGNATQLTSPAGSRDYEYDTTGRLMKTQNNALGNCLTRIYSYTPNTDRLGRTEYSAADDGSCSADSSSTTENRTYDAADRITSPGYVYDSFGRTTTVPAENVPRGIAVQINYYANDNPAAIVVGTETQSYTIDPLGRVTTATLSTGGTSQVSTNHYVNSDSDSPAWVSEPNNQWSRYIEGPLGGLVLTEHSNGVSELQIFNQRGDVVATAANDTAATGVISYSEQDEFGNSSPGVPATKYAWLGIFKRAADNPAGFVMMGRRLYNPKTGRFLQVDPVEGGSANPYDYASQNPINGYDISGAATSCWIGAARWRFAVKGIQAFDLHMRTHWCGTGNYIRARLSSSFDGDGGPAFWFVEGESAYYGTSYRFSHYGGGNYQYWRRRRVEKYTVGSPWGFGYTAYRGMTVDMSGWGGIWVQAWSHNST
ncbi:DNRLRE domain-containing protein [Sphaerisporangium sp. NPDC005289]|uniref:DNRLRE domain-containing protein n=1 Tax=Sphaerisporangium sp. NPDC005289 TaxID=3155247 RepID=UPI0033A38A6B